VVTVQIACGNFSPHWCESNNMKYTITNGHEQNNYMHIKHELNDNLVSYATNAFVSEVFEDDWKGDNITI
jgi:hypothetical protein